MNYRVYEKENENGLFLFPRYFRTKHEAIDYAKTMKNPVLQRKCAYNWYQISM